VMIVLIEPYLRHDPSFGAVNIVVQAQPFEDLETPVVDCDMAVCATERQAGDFSRGSFAPS
jgi:tRNA C32,U32 (ribose-2'-O)-methylase TrmJ